MTTSTTTADAVTHIGVGIDTARFGHRVTFLRDDRQPVKVPLFLKLERSLRTTPLPSSSERCSIEKVCF